ncbi:MAG TPA: carboxypeptidase-like regulatory domain-containing protein [Terracidiphilus sp.]|jgi:hypothetical protein|nr:carboxypeptidase-like regulatory domain-containing protein [Terracidiphilus sp.]
MRKQFFWRGTALALILVGALALAHAVDVNARIAGTVTDPQGAVLPGIQVTLTNEATGVKQVTTTLANGNYLFAQVPVGSYTVSVAASGFKTYQAKGIVLSIDQQYEQAIQLQVGSTSEVVEVAASSVQVNTTDMELSNVVNSEQIVELPLINRNFTGLELTLPGVQASSDRFGTFSVSGGQTQQSEFLINGADTNDIALNTLVISPNIDAIDQFNLIDGPLNAEYDRNSGGIVSATLKAGTNHFHGDVFWFYRDTFLNTANFFQHNFTTGKAVVSPYHQNIPGFTVGGPIKRDKFFGFVGYQATRQRVPESGGSVNVLSNANLGGDFSADLNATSPAKISAFSSKKIPGTLDGVIPGCSAGETWAACLTPLGGVIPTSSFSKISTGLLKFVPGANSGTYGYLFSPVTTTTENQWLGRLDFSVNSANQMYFVGINDRLTRPETLPFTGATVPGFGDQAIESISQYTYDYVHQFSSSLVNDFSAHYTRFNYQAVEPISTNDPSAFGFSIHPQDVAAENIPTIGVSGFFTLGFSTNGPQPRIDQVVQLDDAISKVWGNHTFKFGYDGRRFNVSNPFFAVNSGSYSFSKTSSAYTTGDPSLDFLLGVPRSYSQGTGAEIQADAFLNYGFAQDTWKMTPTFTLSYGLGYSVDTPLHNNQYGGEGIACLIPGEQSKVFAAAPLGVVYPGDPGCNNSGQATTRHGELGPRFGFAWAPDLGALSGGPGKLSIRGGFGIYYDRSEEESALQTLETPPFGLSSGGAADYGASAPNFGNPYEELDSGIVHANKFPYTFPSKGATIDYSTLEPLDISTFGKDFRAPYAENIQLSIEREFPSRIVARVSYVGSLARHNQIDYEGNAETPAGHAACLAGDEYSPYEGGVDNCVDEQDLQSFLFPQNTVYGSQNSDMGIDPNTGLPGLVSAGTVGSGANSSYHSMQVSLEKGLTHGLTFQLSYTYSHALDNGSSFENSGFGGSARGYNQFDKSLNYGSSSFDVRNRAVFSPIYVVPQFSGNQYSARNILLGGWEISGILTLANGFPYDISYGGASGRSLWCSDDFNFYACPDMPSQTAKLVHLNPRHRDPSVGGLGTYFDPTTFTDEPIGQFGNIGRNAFIGPGINNTNVIFAKNFTLSQERGWRFQMRMESDNVFNHTQFSNPTSQFVSGSFGYVSSAAAGRQTQLAGKFYF